eukprot:10856820-Ditylum_brightwellii.AAC.1
MSRTMVQHVTKLEALTDDLKARIKDFNDRVNKRLKDDNFHITDAPENALHQDDQLDEHQDNDVDPMEEAHTEGPDDYTPILEGDSHIKGTVIKCRKGEDGNPIGIRNNNP